MKLRSLEFIAAILLFSCYPEEKFFETPGKVSRISIYFELISSQTDKYFYYNEMGDLVKETRKGQGQEEDILYTYNSKGQLTRKQSKIQGNQYTDNYTYDDAGRLKNRSLGYDYYYDEQSRLSKISQYGRLQNGEKNIIANWVYIYDSLHQKRITDEKYYHGKGIHEANLWEHFEYLYDSDGILVQKNLVDGRPQYYRSTKEFYVYDANGRLYKMLVYSLDPYFYPGLDATHTYYYYE